jgi:glycine/D-amino acid oxidase-like deaminating enzyme
MSASASQRFDAIVVGAGAYGASVAYHLTAAGLAVALLDRRPFVSETSPRAAGLAVQVRTLREFGELAMRSVELLASFEDRTGETLAVSQTGSVAVARDDVSDSRVRAHPELGARYGLEVAVIGPAEAAVLAPYADYRDARSISFTPTDLHLEPGDLPRAYVRAAARRGMASLEGYHAGAPILEDGHVAGLETDGGSLHADVVVNCAGGWLSALAASGARPLPVQPVRHQLVVSEPSGEISETHSSVRIVDANVYARPYAGGVMFGGYESRPAFLDDGALPATVADLPLDMAAIDELRARVRTELPILDRLAVRELRGGIPTLTADGHPVIDRVPDAHGFFVVGGCNVGGLSTSPAVGEAVAAWIASGERPAVLEPFGLARFAGEDPAELRRAARDRYAATEYG